MMRRRLKSVFLKRQRDGVSRDAASITLLWLVGVLGESAENWGVAPVFCSVSAVLCRLRRRSSSLSLPFFVVCVVVCVCFKCRSSSVR
jgi:hypothetical protein